MKRPLRTSAAILCGLLTAFVIIPLILFLAVSFYPPAVNMVLSGLKGIAGIAVTVDGISFGRPLGAVLSGLSVRGAEDGMFSLTTQRADVKSSVGAALRGEVEHLVLDAPRVTLRFKGQETEGETDFIEKIPPVGLLRVSRGELIMVFEERGATVRLHDIDLEMRNVSPRGGGEATFSGAVSITSSGTDGMGGAGRCSGKVALSRLSPQPEGTGELELIFEALTHESASLRNVSLRFGMRMDMQKIALERASVRIGAVEYPGQKGNIQIGDLEIEPTLGYDRTNGELSVRIAKGVIARAGEFSGELRGVLRGDHPWQAAFSATSLSFPDLHRLIMPLLDPLYREWTIQGRGKASAELRGNYREGNLTGEGRLSLTFDHGGFSSPDGTRAAQGMSGSTVIRLRIPEGGGRREAEVSSQFAFGEVLWDRFYHDFGGASVSFSSRGDFSGGSPADLRGSGSLDLFSSGGYAFSGALGEGEWRLSVALRDVRLSRLSAFLVPGLLGEDEAALRGLAVDGVIDGEAAVSGGAGGFSVTGRALLRDGLVRIPGSSLSVEAIDFSSPIDLVSGVGGGHGDRGGGTQEGYLRIGRLDARRLVLHDLNIPFTVSHNSVSQLGGLAAPFFGGRLQIENMRIAELLAAEPSASLSIVIEGADLSLMLEHDAFGPVAGRLDADLPQISYRNGKWAAEGRIDLNVFEGKVQVAGLYGERLLSSSRKIGADIAFEGISLAPLTASLGTGTMTGIIHGGLMGFEMEYGQPSRFVFRAESVDTPGVAQRVSVAAIESISVIGTGSGGIGTVLRSGLNRFFREYPYSRLGIMCRLENDLFTIRGTIHEGGKEYLIRRGFLRGLDVVNQNPDNVIGFKDMRERVSRIFSKDSPAEIKIN